MRVFALAVLSAALAAGLTGSPQAASVAGCAHQTNWLMRFDRSYRAAAQHPLQVYRVPRAGAPSLGFPSYDAYGVRTVFAVLADRLDAHCRIAWFRVQLPMKPNGSTGWVRRADVLVGRLSARIVVDQSEKRLYLYKRGRVVFTSPAAIGKPSTPTPLGRFYVTQRLIPTNQHGPFGPRALGTSAHSTVLTTWTDGGPVGIHGTDEPFSVGRPVSHGCIRLPNAKILRLFALTPLGTPVVVRR